MPKGGFNQVWESSQHLRAARLDADIDWLVSVIGNPTATPVRPDAKPATVPSGLRGLQARLKDALGLHPPAK